jgi:hypothetical protein
LTENPYDPYILGQPCGFQAHRRRVALLGGQDEVVLHDHAQQSRHLGVDVEVILTPSYIFCMDNH